MACFKDAALYAAYLAFHLKKKSTINTMTNQISTATKVLTWFKTTASSEHTVELTHLQDWLSNVRTQLVGSMAKRRLDPVQLEEEDAWLPAHEMVALLDQYRLQVLSRVPKEGLCNPHTARLLHDAALSSCMFGYLPPIRLSCLRSLVIPGMGTTACMDKDCKMKQQCKGNRLLWRQGSLWIMLPHHKNQKRHDCEPIDLQLPEEMQQLMAMYLEKGHPVLASSGMQHMFMDKKGRPMEKAATMTHYWQHLLTQMGAKAKFPPNRLRHIFVDERMSSSRVEGPADNGASQVMGNSEVQWKRVYDLRAFQRDTTAAADAMPSWRAAMLAMLAGLAEEEYCSGVE